MQYEKEQLLKEYLPHGQDIRELSRCYSISYLDKDDRIQLNYKNTSKFIIDSFSLFSYKSYFLIYNYELEIYDNLEHLDLSRLIKSILDIIDHRLWNLKIENMLIEVLKRDTKVIKEMPRYEDYIFFSNGIYNIATKTLEDYKPEIVVTKKLNVSFNEDMKCINFSRFIDDIMMGDLELIDLMQQILGYLLQCTNKAQKFFLFYGTGANGKSVLADILIDLFGNENISSISLAQMSNDFMIGQLVGKVVNISAENETDFESEIIKNIVSGDLITINEKYRNPYIYRSTIKLIFLSNKLPSTKDNSYGFYRRLIIVPFNKIVKENERDPDLVDRLKLEKEGILNWMLDGLHKLIENNYKFSEPSVVSQMKQNYQKGQDPVSQFMKSFITFDQGSRISRKEIFTKYIEWVNNNAVATNGTEKTQSFWREFKRALDVNRYSYEEVKIKGNLYFKNIKWL